MVNSPAPQRGVEGPSESESRRDDAEPMDLRAPNGSLPPDPSNSACTRSKARAGGATVNSPALQCGVEGPSESESRRDDAEKK